MSFPTYVTWCIACWVASVSVCLTIFLTLHTQTDALQSRYFRWGPHSEFIVFGMPVDTPAKYLLITTYSFVNSGIRAAHHTLLQPWILHNVQTIDTVGHVDPAMAYRLTTLATLYTWFDWFIYMNILLSQVDMLVIELTADILTTLVTTRNYLTHKNKKHPENNGQMSLELLPPNFTTSSPSNSIGIHCGRCTNGSRLTGLSSTKYSS